MTGFDSAGNDGTGRVSAPRSRLGWWLAAILGAAAVIGGGFYYMSRSTGTGPAASQVGTTVPVQVTQAKTGPIRTVLTYSGAIQPAQQVNIAPRISGQLASINVEVGSAVGAGQTLATLDPGTLPSQLLQTQAALQSAQARLDLMLAGPRAADVAAAEAAVVAAEARLRQILNPSASDLSAAESTLTIAQTALTGAKVSAATTKNSLLTALSSFCNVYNAVVVKCDTAVPIPAEDIGKLQEHIRTNSLYATTPGGTTGTALITANNAYLGSLNSIASAEVALVAAQDRYSLVRNPSPSDVAAQQSVVATARANLDNRKLPYTDADIAGARATVAAAQAGVAAARTSVEQTSIIAPFSGLVAQRLLEVGATVSPQAPVFTIIAQGVESHITVDEARIGLVRPNMEAEVSVPAFPGRTFKGRVATIAPIGDARAHTFDVKVVAEDPRNELRPGMFAEVNVIAATKPNAILVPTSSIVTQGPTARVFIVVNGKAAAKTVKLGIADATSTEITEGIAAGDQVVTVGQNVLRDGQAVQIATPAPGGGGGAGGAGGGTRPAGATGATGASGATGATGASGAAGSPTPTRATGTP